MLASGGQTRLRVNGQELRPCRFVRQSLASKDVEHESRGIYGVGSRYQAMTEDTADLQDSARATVNCKNCQLDSAILNCSDGLQDSSKSNYQSKAVSSHKHATV
jgi:hypothetical protein